MALIQVSEILLYNLPRLISVVYKPTHNLVSDKLRDGNGWGAHIRYGPRWPSTQALKPSQGVDP